MSRRTIRPLPRAFQTHRNTHRRADDGMWEDLDRVQVLGSRGIGHTGCVNSLSWSNDGQFLLSGSDDQKICIWQPDAGSSSSVSPHPLRLTETIDTGHRANIFSAKFLPHANTPSIVSVSGDSKIKVFEVERLGRERGDSGTWNLDGKTGDGVRILNCHQDRVKRISTEDSPSLFMTVSEDGTVRQHDLRRPHTCPTSCPEPLFHAPKGIDLYSLSISGPAPHIFAVAGRGPHAYICDRRMLPHQSPSWGSHIDSGPSDVFCVRKLGLPEYEWNEVSPHTGNAERHISCVKMSTDCSDEVAVAFMKHGISLFSVYDTPASPSAKSATTSIVPHNASHSDVSSPVCAPSILPRTGLDDSFFDHEDVELGGRGSIQGSQGFTPDHPARGVRGPVFHEDENDSADDADRVNRSHPRTVTSPIIHSQDLSLDTADEVNGESGLEEDEDEFFLSAILGHPLGRSCSKANRNAYEQVDVVYPRKSFMGARNEDTVKDCNFLGINSNKIASGSDEGMMFIWDKVSGTLEGVWAGDGEVVNVMEQHPRLPLIAVSGIDKTIKLFSPIQDKPPNFISFNRSHLADLMMETSRQPVPSIPGFMLDRNNLSQTLMSRVMLDTMPGDDSENGEDDENGNGDGR